jgi:hypothetical protein
VLSLARLFTGAIVQDLGNLDLAPLLCREYAGAHNRK